MVAGHERVGHLGARPAGADGHAVAERLRERDHVGAHAVVLEAEPLAGATEAGLHLVDDQQQVALVAQPPHALEELDGGRVDPAFALHRLEEDRGHRRVDGRLERVEVVPRDVAEPLGQRLERLVLGRLARGVQGGQGAAVEGAVGADDLVLPVAAPLAGELQRGLVGLGAGVGEEDLAAAAQEPVERGRQRAVVLVGEQVRDVHQLAGLPSERVGHLRVGVAERGDGQAPQEVEVAPAVGVVQLRAAPVHELDRGRRIGAHEGAVGEGGRVLRHRGRPRARWRRRPPPWCRCRSR